MKSAASSAPQDGGKTWEKVLYKDAKTGGIDLAFDPTNANIIYAALWQIRRTPWSLESGGPGSGLYRSADGGTTWKQIKAHGLPETIPRPHRRHRLAPQSRIASGP